jgi:hypothetical protein
MTNSNSCQSSSVKPTGHKAPNARPKGQKDYSFTSEEDLKRREYYKKHYHQAKTKATNVNQTPQQTALQRLQIHFVCHTYCSWAVDAYYVYFLVQSLL